MHYLDIKLFLATEILAWETIITKNPYLECQCGLIPYDKDNPCPKCVARTHLAYLKDVKKDLIE